MPATTLSRDGVDVYLGAVDWLREILSRAEVVDRWDQPSAVADYTVGGVAAHAVHGVLWLEQMLKDVEPEGLRRVQVPEYMGLNRVEGLNDDPFAASLRSAAEAFAQTGPHIVAAALTMSRERVGGIAHRGIRIAGGAGPQGGGRLHAAVGIPADQDPRGHRAR
jgi:hypothetical protein